MERFCYLGVLRSSAASSVWRLSSARAFPAATSNRGTSPRRLGRSWTHRRRLRRRGSTRLFPPLAVVTDFSSRHVENARYWEKRDEGLIDPAELPDEDDSASWPQAVSKAQVHWAKGQLRKARSGPTVSQSIAELEALANTPLLGLPERAGRNTSSYTGAAGDDNPQPSR